MIKYLLLSLFTATFVAATTSTTTSFDANFSDSNYVTNNLLDDFSMSPNNDAFTFSSDQNALNRNAQYDDARLVYKDAPSSTFAVGDSWTVSMEFNYKDDPNLAGGTNFAGVGFYDEDSAQDYGASNALNSYITHNKITEDGTLLYHNLRLVIFTPGGYKFETFQHSDIGLDPDGGDYISDDLRISFTITKTEGDLMFLCETSLTNLDTNQVVANKESQSIHWNGGNGGNGSTPTPPEFVDGKLYGHIYGGKNKGDATDENYFNAFNFEYSTELAIPEQSNFTTILGLIFLVSVLIRRNLS